MPKVEGTTPIDAAEIRQCASCGKGVMTGGQITFYEVTAVQCIVDLKNVQRLHGLEMMMGGNVGIARAFSPDNTIAHRVGQPVKHWICQACGVESPLHVAVLAEEAEASLVSVDPGGCAPPVYVSEESRHGD